MECVCAGEYPGAIRATIRVSPESHRWKRFAGSLEHACQSVIVSVQGGRYRWTASTRLLGSTQLRIEDVSSVAWAIAASDLGIRVTAPYSETDRFGMPLSNVVYFVSALNPALYAEYDRDRFIALLTGWGWSGRGQAPDWYHEP